MGCSSCQQNNHVVPTQTTHSHPHATTHCECACGCSEPVCPTPQPCTEITDSKCIIYTDLPIKCGNTTVVTTNASASTALNQIVAYFCSKIDAPISEDIVCGVDVIVTAGSSFEEAVVSVVDWVCQLNDDLLNLQTVIDTINQEIITLTACCDTNTQTNLVQDGQIASLQLCCTENTETNNLQTTQITNIQNQVNAIIPHYKYVHETTTLFDGDSITITRQALEYCNLLPPACSTDPGFVDKVCDLHVSVYYLFAGNWKKIPTKPFGILGTEGYELGIDATTGDITIIFTIAPVDPAVAVRVVILA
jgi:hypothetical protein